MALFKAYSPQVQVNGQTVLAIVHGCGAFKDRASAILAQCGLNDPKPGMWYTQQNWLDAFKVISDTIGPTTLLNIGRSIPENADWPPQVNSVETALASIDVAYHMNHRFGEIGHYTFTSTGPNSGKMVCDNPYPCDFDRGIVEAAARKFAKPGSLVKVIHDDSQPCRKKGQNSCTYLVTW
jgi:hypothetical protein